MGSGLVPFGFWISPIAVSRPQTRVFQSPVWPYNHYIEWGITGLPTIFRDFALWFVWVRDVLRGWGA
jgi:hypothetical protein